MNITIPEYFARFINPAVDLDLNPKQCCPFHKEDTPSFSYSPEKGVWRCFGACKFGGDVIALHQKNFKLRNREEAEKSLRRLLGEAPEQTFTIHDDPKPDERKAAYNAAYAKAILVAKTIKDWEELDYLMGQYPPSTDKLSAYYNARRNAG